MTDMTPEVIRGIVARSRNALNDVHNFDGIPLRMREPINKALLALDNVVIEAYSWQRALQSESD